MSTKQFIEEIPVSPLSVKRCGECGCPEGKGAKGTGHATYCPNYDHRKAVTKFQIELRANSRNLSPEAQACINEVVASSPQTREETAAIIRRHGFYGYQGGRHVALINGKDTLATFTSGAPDFN